MKQKTDKQIIDEFLKKNGGPRRFERGASSDPFNLMTYLQERGYDVRGSAGRSTPQYKLGKKIITHSQFMEIVENERRKDGLESLYTQNHKSKKPNVLRSKIKKVSA